MEYEVLIHGTIQMNLDNTMLQNWRTGGLNKSCLGGWCQWEGRGGRERVWEGEYGANTVYSCM
jgi:hypothetical protein